MRTAKLIASVLALTLVWLTWSFCFSQGGYFRQQELTAQFAELDIDNRKALARNTQLAAEVVSLKSGAGAIEERARHDLAMVRGDEILFRINRPEKFVPGTKISADIVNDPLYRPQMQPTAERIEATGAHTPTQKELAVELPPKASEK